MLQGPKAKGKKASGKKGGGKAAKAPTIVDGLSTEEMTKPQVRM